MSEKVSRYVVGIDLGTTHCALSYVDTAQAGSADSAPCDSFDIPQLVAQNQVAGRPLLPSFLYQAHESDGAQDLPWEEGRSFAVGEYARSRGQDAPQRLVASAKSWLCHPSVDRRAPLLPTVAPEDLEKVSPVEATFRYLEHLSEAWDHAVAKGNADDQLSNQSVVITVPASFDAGARELTAEAAMAAGYDQLTLLEEPQAAVYAWLDGKGDGWRKQLSAGDLLLVVDIGGGTTDFSAISVVEKEGNLELVRVAVGDHILLGGDNMDLALAYTVKQRLEKAGNKVDSWQLHGLLHSCRVAKEKLLAGEAEDVPIAVASRSSKLFANTMRSNLTQADVHSILLEGFFPKVDKSALPKRRARAALTRMGLPYAQDAAITRHLAAFLKKHGGAAGEASEEGLKPTAILFNGGVLKAPAVKARLMETLASWLPEHPLRELSGADLDLSVARGAAVYGRSRRGKGIRIRGGTARSYYVGIEGAAPAIPGLEPPLVAMCVAPFGMEEGSRSPLPEEELGLVVGEPVRFRFFAASTLREDTAGVSHEDWDPEVIAELPPIELTLPAEGRQHGEVVPVYLQASVTEVGTLLVEAIAKEPLVDDERWKVELSVRGDGTE